MTGDEKERVPNNGSGKDYAGYIKVTHGEEVICLESDAMEPEDTRFCRDLKWIEPLLKKCYELGVLDKELMGE